MKTITEQLVTARKAAGMTQQEVADALGITRIHYNRIERSGDTTADTLRRIAKVLHTTIELA